MKHREFFRRLVSGLLVALLLAAALPTAFAAKESCPGNPDGDHYWGEWTTVRKATCSRTGQKERACVYCRGKDTKRIPKKDHTWGSWKVVAEPTDSSAGQKKRTCSVCDESEKKAIYPEGTLKNGDRGEAVKALQDALNAKGYDCGEADGVYGERTAEAVKDVERQIGISPDGITWPAVIDTLNAVDEEAVSANGCTFEKWEASVPANGHGYYEEGETVTYGFSVVNDHSAEDDMPIMLQVEIYDPMLDSEDRIAYFEGILPGGEDSCMIEYTVTAEDVARGYIENTATVTWKESDAGANILGESRESVSNTVTVYTAPQDEDGSVLSIELLSFSRPEGEETDNCAEGELRITNNGTTGIFVSNYDSRNKNGVIMGEDHFISPTNHSELDPGESMVFSYITYIEEDPDVIDGMIIRDITVFGTEIDGGEEDAIKSNTVHAELALSETPETVPNVHLEKWIGSSPANGEYYVEGETITYELELVNDSDEPITDIEIDDPMKGSNEDACVDRVESIAAGSSYKCSFDHVVTARDAADCVIYNQAYASWAPDGEVYSDEIPADTGSESGRYYAKFEDCVFVGGTYNDYFTISDVTTGSVYHDPTPIYGDIDKLGLEYDWHTDSSVEVWYRGTVTQPGIGRARYTMLVDDDLWTIDIVLIALQDGDAEMIEDLHIDLLSFEGEQGMAVDSPVHGEIRVTNVGNDTLKVYTGWIETTTGDFLSGEDFGTYPANAFALAPNDSFYLTFTAIIREEDRDAGAIERDITMVAELADGSDDALITSNTVRASLALENDIVVDMPVEDTGALVVTKKEFSVPAKGYYEKGDIITYMITLKNNIGMDICDIYVYDCLATGYIGYSLSLGAGEERSFTFDYQVTEADISEPYLIINYADVVYNLRGIVDTAYSNEVRSRVGESTDPIPPETPIPPTIDTPVSEGDCCERRIVERGEEDASYMLHYCAAHLETQKAVAGMVQAAATPDMELAAWQYARQMWQDDADAMYDELMRAANGPAKLIVLNERVLFNGQIATHEAALDALYPDSPARVAREIAELYMNRCVGLCYELHNAPQDRTDDLMIPEFRANHNADRPECGYIVLNAHTDIANGKDIHYNELLCRDHSAVNASVEELLISSGAAEGTWKQIRTIWEHELQTVYQLHEDEADSDTAAVLRADLESFENWLDARTALVRLLYPDREATVMQLGAKTVMDRVMEMCGEIG